MESNKPELVRYISKFYITEGKDVFSELREAGISDDQLMACELFFDTNLGRQFQIGESFIEDYIDEYDFSNPIHLITYIGDRYGDGEVFGPLKI